MTVLHNPTGLRDAIGATQQRSERVASLLECAQQLVAEQSNRPATKWLKDIDAVLATISTELTEAEQHVSLARAFVDIECESTGSSGA
jgi:hypothetical protein